MKVKRLIGSKTLFSMDKKVKDVKDQFLFKI